MDIFGDKFIIYGEIDATMTLMQTDENLKKVIIKNGSLFVLTDKFVHCLDAKDVQKNFALPKKSWSSMLYSHLNPKTPNHGLQ